MTPFTLSAEHLAAFMGSQPGSCRIAGLCGQRALEPLSFEIPARAIVAPPGRKGVRTQRRPVGFDLAGRGS
jgi:hypothetical protein